MVRDGGDTIIQSFEPYILLSAATAPGSLQRIATHLKFSRARASDSEPFFSLTCVLHLPYFLASLGRLVHPIPPHLRFVLHQGLAGMT